MHFESPDFRTGFLIPAFYLMNPDSWNRLPADIQQLIEDKLPLLKQGNQGAVLGVNAYFMGEAEAAGDTMSYLTPEELSLWTEAVGAPTADKWVAEMEAKGLPAQAALDEVKSIIAKYAE